MASEKTGAIVIRVVEFSETSLILTLLTRDFGKASVIAKGARRPKSPFEGALDLLSVCRVVIIPKSGDTLDLLTEAKLERRFRAGERDLNRLYAGYYVAELLRELTDRDDPHPELYDLALETLAELDGETDLRACLLRFELQTLRILGHAPTTYTCAGCGRDTSPEASSTAPDSQDVAAAPHARSTDRVGFALQAGGFLCDACRRTTRGVTLLRQSSRGWMAAALAPQQPLAPPPEIPAGCHGELRGVMNRYIANLVGGPLRMLPYLPGEHASSMP